MRVKPLDYMGVGASRKRLVLQNGLVLTDCAPKTTSPTWKSCRTVKSPLRDVNEAAGRRPTGSWVIRRGSDSSICASSSGGT